MQFQRLLILCDLNNWNISFNEVPNSTPKVDHTILNQYVLLNDFVCERKSERYSPERKTFAIKLT